MNTKIIAYGVLAALIIVLSTVTPCIAASPSGLTDIGEINKTKKELEYLGDYLKFVKDEVTELKGWNFWITTYPYNTFEKELASINIDKAEEAFKKGDLEEAELCNLNAKLKIESLKYDLSLGMEIFVPATEEILKCKIPSAAENTSKKLSHSKWDYEDGKSRTIPSSDSINHSDGNSMERAVEKYEGINKRLQQAAYLGNEAYHEAKNLSDSKTNTKITIYPSEIEIHPDESITLTATLRDSNDIPLPGKKIIWESESGNLDQTSGNTDRQGNVSVVYQASTAPQTVKITALFEGDTLYEKTCDMSTITIIKRPPPWWLWIIVVIAVGISIIIVLHYFGRLPWD